MTKKEMFALIASVNADNAEIVDFCNHEIELLSNRKSSSNTKKSAESEARANAVYSALSEVGEAVTVTDLIGKASNEVAGYSNQRVSALLRKLIEAGKVEKQIEGKKALFRVVA